MSERAQSPDPTDGPSSSAAVERIGRALGRFDLSLLGDDADTRRAGAQRLATDYLVPRLREPDGALVIAIVGVSGSGKSTLLNSLARRRISAEGLRRPTTVGAVAWSGGDLPGTLDALRRRLPGRLVDTLRPPPDGIVIVDTPPPGVTDEQGRSIAEQILDVADACVLVAGGTRYADVIGFDLADRAAARGLPTVFVLNRLPPTPEIGRVIAGDFAAKLAGRGLIDRPSPELIVPIVEGPVSEDTGGLGGDWVTGLRKEIEALADPDNRPLVLRQVLHRSLSVLRRSLLELRPMLIEYESRRSDLADPVRIAYGDQADALIASLRSGAYAETGADRATFAATLASAAARRAARASRRAAERWGALAPDLVDTAQIGHGPEVPAAATERIGWWEAEVPGLATAIAESRVGARRGRRLTDAVRRSVADRTFSPSRRDARVLRRFPGIVDAARGRLEEELAGILDADANRFLRPLGPGLPDGLLADLRLEAGT